MMPRVGISPNFIIYYEDGQKRGNTFYTYQQLIVGQARKAVRFLLQKDKVYEGFTWNW